MRNSTRFLLDSTAEISGFLRAARRAQLRPLRHFLNDFLINYGRLMKVVTQVAEQRKALEQAVSQALELARADS